MTSQPAPEATTEVAAEVTTNPEPSEMPKNDDLDMSRQDSELGNTMRSMAMDMTMKEGDTFAPIQEEEKNDEE